MQKVVKFLKLFVSAVLLLILPLALLFVLTWLVQTRFFKPGVNYAFIGIVLLLVLVFFCWVMPLNGILRKARWLLLVVLVFLSIIMVPVYISLLQGAPIWDILPPQWMDKEMRAGLDGVCSGSAIPGAAAFSGQIEEHSLAWMDVVGGGSLWDSLLPRNWRARKLAEVSVVVCPGKQELEVIETCHYVNGFPITRSAYRLPVRLVEARTGNLVGEIGLNGKYPRACRSGEESSTRELKGQRARFFQVKDWLQPLLAYQPNLFASLHPANPPRQPIQVSYCDKAVQKQLQGVHTYLCVVSQPGDPVGVGESVILGPSSPEPVEYFINSERIWVAFDEPKNIYRWHVDIYSEAGKWNTGTFTTTIYPQYGRISMGVFPDLTHGAVPKMDNYRCGSLFNRIEILEMITDANGQPQKYAVNFEQQCGSSAGRLAGYLRWNSTIP
jgi:hypothetical protein